MGDGNGEMGMKGREWGGGNEGTGIGRWESGNKNLIVHTNHLLNPQSTQIP